MPSDHLPSFLNRRPGQARFPRELVNKVIKELDDEKGVLKQCSLVAKSWDSEISPRLLRRVLWPPCATKVDICEDTSADATSTPCKYATRSQNSFALCVEILSLSSRLQREVRELVCMPPNEKHGPIDDARGALELKTFVQIVNHLPHLESIDLQLVTLRADAPLPSVETRRTLKKLSASSSSADWLWTLFPFLSSFERVQHLVLTVYKSFPQGWPTDRAPSSKLAVEILECNHRMEQPLATSSLSFYAGLVHNLDLRALLRFVSNDLQPGFTGVISAAPALESLGLHRSDRRLPLEVETIPPRLTSVDVGCTFAVHMGLVILPSADGTWNSIWETLRAAVQFPIRSILVNVAFSFFQLAGVSNEDLYTQYEGALSQITQWQTAVQVLDDFGLLESIIFMVRFNVCQPVLPVRLKSIHVHERQLASMQDTMNKGLPRRYGDILHVKAADLEFEASLG
ncbi:hypothetical protein PsYK624_157400 [Phanerochaete sordida]|uniref:Uncharacterized protein n=1 Tax=Phanerochaete sordida TaxID=48140 RepID=A0A9P3LLE5_9APHY|nr:hypothetical protein PsYK624_157400 [Phanerochaete sordida]